MSISPAVRVRPPHARGAAVRRQPTVLLLWSGRRPGPWTGRSLIRHGMVVIAAHPVGAPGGWAPRDSVLLRYPDPAEAPIEAVDWVRRRCATGGIDAILALDETLVGLLSAARDTLGARLIGPDAAQYRALCDKSVLPVTCADAGVGHPMTWMARSAADALLLPGNAWVVKPARSAAGAPPVRVTTRRDDLVRCVEGMLAAGADPIVQERLSGRQWGIWCAITACGVTGVAARVRETSPRAAGTPSRFIVDGGGTWLVREADRLLRSTGFRGIANLDVIEIGGRAQILDVNLRPAASAGLPVRAGLDLAAIAVADALGLPMPAPRRFRPFAYTSAEGELDVLTARRPGERPALTALRLAGDLARRGVMVDPSPVSDPSWYRSLISRAR